MKIEDYNEARFQRERIRALNLIVQRMENGQNILPSDFKGVDVYDSVIALVNKEIERQEEAFEKI